MLLIAPSILSGDFAKLGDECKELLEAGADWLHIDIMDGHFVPNLTIGPPVVRSLRRCLGKEAFLDCHCMVSNPDQWVEELAKAGANQVTFHWEASPDPQATIERITAAGMRAAIAIKPSTSVEEVLMRGGALLADISMILVMTVEPGWGGQSLIPDCLEKVRRLRQIVPAHLDIQVDGGITMENLPLARDAGANVIVAGTLIMGATSKANIIKRMHQCGQ